MTGPADHALVLTVSDRAAAGQYADRSGPLLVAGLREWATDGQHPIIVDEPHLVPDGEPVGAALRAAVRDRVALVVTTGGTGLAPRDLTPEQTRSVLDRELPGVAEALRAFGVANGVPTAMLSRGVAGVAGRTVIVNLPGSTGGCRDGLAVLTPVLWHLLEQVRDGAGH